MVKYFDMVECIVQFIRKWNDDCLTHTTDGILIRSQALNCIAVLCAKNYTPLLGSFPLKWSASIKSDYSKLFIENSVKERERERMRCVCVCANSLQVRRHQVVRLRGEVSNQPECFSDSFFYFNFNSRQTIASINNSSLMNNKFGKYIKSHFLCYVMLIC